jgi:hypothetical protein
MVRSITKDTVLCMSVAGRPSNVGTRFHNFLYAELELDYVYKAFTTTDLAAAIAGIRALGIRGCGSRCPSRRPASSMWTPWTARPTLAAQLTEEFETATVQDASAVAFGWPGRTQPVPRQALAAESTVEPRCGSGLAVLACLVGWSVSGYQAKGGDTS